MDSGQSRGNYTYEGISKANLKLHRKKQNSHQVSESHWADKQAGTDLWSTDSAAGLLEETGCNMKRSSMLHVAIDKDSFSHY